MDSVKITVIHSGCRTIWNELNVLEDVLDILNCENKAVASLDQQIIQLE